MSKTDIRESIRELNSDALQAIGSGRVDWGREVVEAYREVLTAYPKAWAQFGLRLDANLLRGLTPFHFNEVELVVHDLYEQMRLASTASTRDFASMLAYLPFGVVIDTAEFGATGLAQKMCQVLVNGYFIGRSSAPDSPGNILRIHCSRHLLQIGQFVFEARLEKAELPLDQRLNAARGLAVVFAAINDVLKELVQAGDSTEFERIDKSWSGLMEDFFPEIQGPTSAVVELLAEQLGPDDASVVDARATTEAIGQLIDARDQLVGHRKILRFGLLMWSVHKMLAGELLGAGAPIFMTLAAHFQSLDELVEVAGKAIRAEFYDTVPWSVWFSAEMPEGEVHVVPTQTELLRAFALVALVRTNPDPEAAPTPFIPEEWIGDYSDQIKGAVAEIARNGDLLEALRVDEVPRRAEVLMSRIDLTVKAWRDLEAEEVRVSVLDPERVETFTSSLIKAWSERTIVRSILRSGGPPAVEPTAIGDEEGWYGFDNWMPKELFVPSSRFIGIEMNAADFGLQLTTFEEQQFVQLLAGNARPLQEPTPDDFKEAVSRALLQARTDAEGLVVVLLPLGWRAVDSLGLHVMLGPRPSPPRELQLPATLGPWYQGMYEQTHVLTLRAVPSNRAFVVAVPRFFSWSEPSLGEQPLRVRLTSYDEQEAKRAATENPEIFSQEVGDDPEVRAQRIRERVLLHVRGRLVMRVADATAAIGLTVTGAPE